MLWRVGARFHKKMLRRRSFGWCAICNKAIDMTVLKVPNVPSLLPQTPAALLSEALRLHQSGALGKALELYDRILAHDARHLDALHLSGVAQYQSGQLEEAEGRIRRALQGNPRVASYHSNLGLVLEARQQPEAALNEYLCAIHLQEGYADAYLNLGNLYLVEGRVDEAIATFNKLLSIHPQFSSGLNSLGCAYRAQGNLLLASNYFRQTLALDPMNAQTYCNLGSVLRQMGALDDALVCFQNALRLQPNSVDALNQIGGMLVDCERAKEAIGLHRKALSIAPRSAESFVFLARALHGAGALDEAIDCCRKALEAQPDFVAALGELANLLREQNKSDEAKLALAQALAIKPDYAEAHNTFGVILAGEELMDEAREHLQKAIELKPGFPEAYNNLGIIDWNCGAYDEARRAYQQSLAARPSYTEARWNLALAQLIDGDYAEGWRNYEARWKRATAPRHFERPIWRGEPLNGARILLHCEQGLGDTLEFLRFVPLVVAAGGKVILDVPTRIVPLAKEIPGLEAVVAKGRRLPEFNLHCPLMSLPLALGITLENLPAQTPYLTIPAAARKRAGRVAWPADVLRVGLAWSGSAKNAYNPKRNIPVEAFAPLFTVPGVQFYSLQMNRIAKNAVVDLAAYQNDLADAAALVEHLDLVISVDTMMAHLAGAIGRPVWTLLSYAADWRWLRDRTDSPWYPTMRLFRQPRQGDWAAVMEEVRGELEKAGTRDQRIGNRE